LTRQYGLIDRSAALSLAVSNKAFLPQLSLSAKATYQSAVTEIPENLGTLLGQLTGQPVQFDAMPRDQYQATLELQQLIWDGGMVNATRKATLAGSDAERRQLDTELHSLKDRINSLFFGVLILDEQRHQVRLLLETLATNKTRLHASLANGVALPGDLDALEVEIISLSQQEAELTQHRRTYLHWLCAFTGLPYSDDVTLTMPASPLLTDSSNHRPELALFMARETQLDAQRSSLAASTRPQLGFFVQGGVGRPGLNLFSDALEPFYIGGLRLSWQLGRWYTHKDNLRKLDLNQQSLEAQRATFLFNNNLEVTKIRHDIEQLTASLAKDDTIVLLRRRIKEASEAKYANGTLTYSDLLRDINAEHQAIQTRSMHRIQRELAAHTLLHRLNQPYAHP
jgi:outer membrane protein TolC